MRRLVLLLLGLIGGLVLIGPGGAGEPTTTSAALTCVSGQASASGNTTLVTPASGLRIRLFLWELRVATGVTARLRFGAAGALFGPGPLGGLVSERSGITTLIPYFTHGAPDEALILNQTLAIATDWTVCYVEAR